MRWMAAGLLLFTAALGLLNSAEADTIGTVLMHGKTGLPATVIDGLATALQGAGFVVDTPERCWSR